MSTPEIPVDFYTNLGKSGLKISKIILGCMGFGTNKWLGPFGEWIENGDEQALKIMKAAYDAGIRTFDTADVYSAGQSERLVGRFIKEYKIPRETIVILSKCFFYLTLDHEVMMGDAVENINRKGLSRKHILDAAALSVERLGTYMDVLQIHRYDPTVPDEEVMKALNDVVELGHTRYIGASSMYVHQFMGLQHTAEKHGWHKFISMQNFYHILYREEEREMIPYCKQSGVGLIPWSPIGGGILAKPRDKQDTTARGKALKEFNRPILEGPNFVIVDRVEELAKKYGVSMAIIAMAWSLAKGCNPIMGLTKVERIEEAVKATTITLSDEDIKYLDELYQPVPVSGMD